MSRCVITLEEIPDGIRYSRAGLKRLDPRLMDIQLLPYTLAQQLEEAAARAHKMSVQGGSRSLALFCESRRAASRSLTEVVGSF